MDERGMALYICWQRKARNMRDSFPLLKMNYEQLCLLMAQLLVYQQYLQKKVAPSAKRNRTLRILLALLQRLQAFFQQSGAQMALLLTVEEVAMMKDALAVLKLALEAKPASAEREREIQRLAAMKTLLEQTFPLIQD
jgi:hypothetical protein